MAQGSHPALLLSDRRNLLAQDPLLRRARSTGAGRAVAEIGKPMAAVHRNAGLDAVPPARPFRRPLSLAMDPGTGIPGLVDDWPGRRASPPHGGDPGAGLSCGSL